MRNVQGMSMLLSQKYFYYLLILKLNVELVVKVSVQIIISKINSCCFSSACVAAGC